MKYYKEAQEKKQQDKFLKWQNKEIKKSEENMLKNIKQILCRTLKFCKNGDTQYCMYCKWNKTCISPQGDYFIAKVPGIKVLP